MTTKNATGDRLEARPAVIYVGVDLDAKCVWYVSIDQPQCGQKATNKVTIKTQVAQVTVLLCDEHKHIHNENFARRRAAQKARSVRG